jgi:thioredoxin-like negative regulator of GroEL
MQFSSNAAKSKSTDLEAMTVQDFKQILSLNPGHVVLKLGAEWCGPCKKIEPLIVQWFNHCPDSVACYKIDIDESFELYATFKTKRQVNGIPALLCFRKGNLDVIPDFTVTGADTTQVNQFFQKILGETK